MPREIVRRMGPCLVHWSERKAKIMKCAFASCSNEACIPVRVLTPDDREGTVHACADCAEKFVEQLEQREQR